MFSTGSFRILEKNSTNWSNDLYLLLRSLELAILSKTSFSCGTLCNDIHKIETEGNPEQNVIERISSRLILESNNFQCWKE